MPCIISLSHDPKKKVLKEVALSGAAIAILPHTLSSEVAKAALQFLPGSKNPKLEGVIFTPGHAEWENVRRGFYAAAPYHSEAPLAVVFCSNSKEVSASLQYCVQKKIPFRVRAGGHNYEGYSSTCRGGVILDVSQMKKISYQASTGRITFGAGIRMFEAYQALGEIGRAMPLATRPTVGIAGLTLGGGVGITSRKWGTTADQLVSLKIILSNGKEIVVSRTQYPDLFWACSGGGGGNVGIVTEFTYQTHPISEVGVIHIRYSWNDFEKVVDTWQKWNDKASVDVTSVLALTWTDGTSAPFIDFYGQFTPDANKHSLASPATQQKFMADFQQSIAPMLQIETLSKQLLPMPAKIANVVILGLDPKDVAGSLKSYRKDQIYKASSSYAMRNMTIPEIRSLKKMIEQAPKPVLQPSQPTMIQLLSGGGKVATAPTRSSPNIYRKAKFIVQIDGYWTAPSDEPATRLWVRNVRNFSLKFARGTYINYMDKGIRNINQVAFGKPNTIRLQQIQRKYDPTRVFQQPQNWQQG